MKSLRFLLGATICLAQNQYVVSYAGSANSSNDLHTYLAGSLQSVAQLNGTPPGVFQVLYSPEGTKAFLLADGSGPAVAAVSGEFRNLRTIATNFVAKPAFAAFQPDGRRMIVAAGRIYLIHAESETVLNPTGVEVEGTPFDIAFRPDSTVAYVLSRRGSIGPEETILTAIDLQNLAKLGTLSFPGNSQEIATGIFYAPNGRLYLSSYGRVDEIDPSPLRLTTTFSWLVRGHPNRGTATLDGRYLIFPNRLPAYGGSIIQIDLATKRVSYDVSGTGEVFSKLVPTTDRKMHAYASSGRLYDLTVGEQLILANSPVNARFQNNSGPPLFPNLSFSSDVPPSRMWFTQSNPGRIVQVGLTASDQTVLEQPTTQGRQISVVGPAATSGASRLVGFNRSQFVLPQGNTPLPLVARLVDQQGRPVFRSAINFSSDNPAVGIHPNTAFTGIDGLGQVDVIAPLAAGSYTIRATGTTGGVTPAEFRITVADSINLRITGGDLQQTRENQSMPDPLAVTVIDRNGAPMPYWYRVAWTVLTPGSGTLSFTETMVSGAGTAQNFFKSSGRIGPVQVQASIVGVPGTTVIFQLETVPTIVGRVEIVTGNHQTARSGNEFERQLRVRVTDASYRLLPDVAVNFAASAGVLLSDTTMRTNRDGEAFVTARAGTLSGVHSVSASAVSVNSPQTTFSLTVAAAVGLSFTPTPPCRFADTRNGSPAGPRSQLLLVPWYTCLAYSGGGGAYAMNLTVVPRGPLSYVTLFPSGRLEPLVSTLNSTDGRIKANSAIVQAGSTGGVYLSATDPTDVIADFNGYFLPSEPNGLLFYPIAPCRLLDTREDNAPLGARAIMSFTLSRCIGSHLPVGAVSLNATVIPRNGRPFGYLTLWPNNWVIPEVSTLNALTGTVTANAAILQVHPSGILRMYGTDEADVVIDVNGFFGPPNIASIPGGGMRFYAITPCRVADSRVPSGLLGGVPLTAGVARTLPVRQSACGIPSNATAYVLNATVVPNGVFGYLSLWPTGMPQPVVSTLNAVDGFVTSNMAIVPAGTNGNIEVFGSNSAHVVFDISGYFAP